MKKIIHSAFFLFCFIIYLITICLFLLLSSITIDRILITRAFIALFFGGLFIYIFSFLVGNFITKKITEFIDNQFKLASLSIDNLYESDNTLSPIFSMVLSERRKNNILRNSLKDQKIQLAMIIENMREGLIVLSKEREVLLINNSAKSIFSTGNVHCDGKNIIELTRNLSILEKVDSALSTNDYQILELLIEDKYYKLFLNPIQNKGLIILVLDITDSKKFADIKKDFSANVSHELKTPLTIINGFAELISSKMVTDYDSILSFASKINNEGQRLLALINDIMFLSNVENGSIIDNSVITNVYDVALRVASMLAPLSSEKSIEITVSGEPFFVNVNERFIEQIIYNLVDNSIKYNNQNGLVKIQILNNSITVFDNGIGIPNSDIDRIFERFYRVDKSRHKATGGTGLGLSIVKNIAEQAGAKIHIKSVVGEYTSITISFEK